ncbi:DUF3817 domain-containing protein [Streptomyces sp. TRM 70361]|uniref:DUF3817 domain-containing protein n=1 Tax=Streptomyces sp. TRM 70361 TaxID=3116553 RepID=UPI002E7AF6D8|nr:DUF3817 domain-containing protein [Streptomyces sp. TRM 70361]MEE1942414.1 DUF3817 domain-containing protein [Streptomyces sp. TRM 70361]
MRVLRIAAGAEAASLAVLLLNLFTVHAEPVSSLMGPLHGMAYLVTIIAVWQVTTAADPAARWYSLVPGAGGLLALRRVGRGTGVPEAGR